MGECWIYKAFHVMEPCDKLLYVGISDTPSDRMNQHARDKWWWHLVTRVEWLMVDSRERAASLETRLIEQEKPLFNKHQSTLTAGSVLCGCLDLVRYSFEHCPLCHSACRHSRVNWETKFLCTVDLGDDVQARCFEVRMQCDVYHQPLEWTQLIPIEVLCACRTQMPEAVIESLWTTATSNGEVSEDIPELRPPTLADMFCLAPTAAHLPHLLLTEAK